MPARELLNMRQKLKILLFIVAAGSFSQCEKYSSVKIIDENFLEALTELGVDTDGDGTISFREAAEVKTLDIYYCDIFDLTGIEWFINLETLRCGNNDYTDLDVSQNTTLKYLDIGHNKLSSLDVSHNINLETLVTMYNPLGSLDISKNSALKHLYCESNQLTSLDVTNNKALDRLECSDNLLTTLNTSNNPELWLLHCGNNQISTLDISNNTKIYQLAINGMQSLTRVCVWKIPFPVEAYTTGSPNIYYTTDCSK